MNDTELIRRLFSDFAEAEARRRFPDRPIAVGTVELIEIGDLSLYAAHLRLLLRAVLRCEQVIELLTEPGLPELRGWLKCLIEIERKVGFPEDRIVKDPTQGWT